MMKIPSAPIENPPSYNEINPTSTISRSNILYANIDEFERSPNNTKYDIVILVIISSILIIISLFIKNIFISFFILLIAFYIVIPSHAVTLSIALILVMYPSFFSWYHFLLIILIVVVFTYNWIVEDGGCLFDIMLLIGFLIILHITKTQKKEYGREHLITDMVNRYI